MTVIGGHQRLTVLKDLGYTEVQCVAVHIENEHNVKALNIALNKITGAWNEQLLVDLLVDLQSVDFNTDLTGFEAPEIEQLFSKVHNKDIKEDDFDVEQELKNPPVSQKGDICHHTYGHIQEMDHQILVEADFLVNLAEDHASEEAVRHVLKTVFRTESGIRFLKSLYKKLYPI